AVRTGWRWLPKRVRRRLAPTIRRLIATAAPTVYVTPAAGGPPIDVEGVSSLDALDGKLREIDSAYARSHGGMRAVFRSFRMDCPVQLPEDPYSQAYRDAQFELYRMISGRNAYAVENEKNDFEITADRPFPYYTESADTVGQQLMGVGFIIKTM